MTSEFLNLKNVICCNAVSSEIIKIIPFYQIEAQK